MTDPRITIWTDDMEAQLKAMWGCIMLKDISQAMGLSEERLRHRAKRLGLPLKPLRRLYEPTKAVWIDKASIRARELRQAPREVLAGAKGKKPSLARWRAWKDVLDEFPCCSIAGVARISGFDHTSVLHGLRRLGGAMLQDTRLSRASGRYPSRQAPIPKPVQPERWDHNPLVAQRDYIFVASAE